MNTLDLAELRLHLNQRGHQDWTIISQSEFRLLVRRPDDPRALMALYTVMHCGPPYQKRVIEGWQPVCPAMFVGDLFSASNPPAYPMFYRDPRRRAGAV